MCINIYFVHKLISFVIDSRIIFNSCLISIFLFKEYKEKKMRERTEKRGREEKGHVFGL